MNLLLFSFFCFFGFSSEILISEAAPQQIDAVLLDELLREIVDSSMSELRHKLQEAVFASAFRRRIQSATSSRPTTTTTTNIIDKFLDEYLKRSSSSQNLAENQKLDSSPDVRVMSLALETFTTTKSPSSLATRKPVELVTAESVEEEEEGKKEGATLAATGRMFDDADAMKEQIPSWQSQFHQLPRVPIWVAITVCTICIICFFLLIASLVFYLSQRKRKRQVQLVQRAMPDPLTVAGLCHSSDCMASHSSRRSSYILEQDRGGSIIWAS